MTMTSQLPIARDRSLELAALPNAVPLARAHVASVLKDWHVAPEVIESAKLLVSELATNTLDKAAEHGRQLAYPELDGIRLLWLRLRMRRDGARLLIEVRDTDLNPPVAKEATPDDESGRGLVIVGALSRDWGYFYSGTFKTVWCEMECALAA